MRTGKRAVMAAESPNVVIVKLTVAGSRRLGNAADARVAACLAGRVYRVLLLVRCSVVSSLFLVVVFAVASSDEEWD